MTRQQFIIPGRLPGLNDYTKANRTNAHVGAKMKRDAEDRVTLSIALNYVQPVKKPVRVSIAWHEKDARRDPDNVSFACKFILDALVKCGILPDDNQANVRHISHDVLVDKANPRIVVTLEEAS